MCYSRLCNISTSINTLTCQPWTNWWLAVLLWSRQRVITCFAFSGRFSSASVNNDFIRSDTVSGENTPVETINQLIKENVLPKIDFVTGYMADNVLMLYHKYLTYFSWRHRSKIKRDVYGILCEGMNRENSCTKISLKLSVRVCMHVCIGRCVYVSKRLVILLYVHLMRVRKGCLSISI